MANPATKATKKRGKDESDDPLKNDRYIRTFMNLVIESVQYDRCISWQPKLSVDQFMRLRMLYLIDRFYQYDDNEIQERIGYDPKTLAKLRSHVHYPAIGREVEQAAEILASPRTFEEWANESQDKVAKEMMLMGLQCKNPKERLAALTAFADRVSAKKGREEETRTPQIVLPENILRLMEKAAQMQPAAIQVQAESSTVDAGRLNVPHVARASGG